MKEEFNAIMLKVQEWARDKDLDKANTYRQMLKLQKEVGELAEALLKFGPSEIINAIGDVMIALTVLCLRLNICGIDECYRLAYEEIKDRKCKTINGVFIKDGEQNVTK